MNTLASLNRVIAVTGLPRSGTTLLTATLSVHPRIATVYEPWNGRDLNGPEDANLAKVARAAGFAPPKSVILVKETSVRSEYIQYLELFLESIPKKIRTDMIFITRNPAHIYASEIEGRRQWWGDHDLESNADTFQRWIMERRLAVKSILSALEARRGLLLSYEALVTRPNSTLAAAMGELGLPAIRESNEYEKHFDRRIVRGDQTILQEARPISTESLARRAEDETEIHALAAASDQHSCFMRMTELSSLAQGAGVLRFPAGPDLTHIIEHL